MKIKTAYTCFCILLASPLVTLSANELQSASKSNILIEAESFAHCGGWAVDPQFMDHMGSPYLLAHGLGRPVADATTKIEVSVAGNYRVWVRTKDWVAQWKAPGAPGKFQVLVNGKALEPIFGITGAQWHWQEGGVVELSVGNVAVALHDLTGFEGRCDAILFLRDPQFIDAAYGDFRVKEGSLALRLGFVNFPMDQFGIQSPRLKRMARTPAIPVITPGVGRTDMGVGAPVTCQWRGATLRELEGLEFSAVGVAADAGGVFVVEAFVKSPAFEIGLRKGDYIQGVNEQVVRGVKDFLKTVNPISEGAKLKLDIIRNQQQLSLTTSYGSHSSELQ